LSCAQTKSNPDYTLYLVTDRSLMTSATLEEGVQQAIAGGCSVVQLREKDLTARAFYEAALSIRKVTQERNVPLIINDRLDIAMAVGADGVHLGQKDLPCKEARKLLGDRFLIGVSAATVEEAEQAEADGADYLGVGAMHTTATKTNTRPVTPSLLSEIVSAVSIPVVAIGGIQKDNVAELADTNISGVAVVSAVLGQRNIPSAAKALRSAVEALKR
jgi:thiamine-phosphate pyrophosphorylase